MQAQPGAEVDRDRVESGGAVGKSSLTVTGVPSVGACRRSPTVSVNVVVPPETNCGECDFAIVRSGAATVVTTSLLTADSGVPRLCPRNSAEADS